MTTITFLGGSETGDVAFCQWGRFKFIFGQPVECNDPHIIAKAGSNRFFKVDGGGGQAVAEIVPDDPEPISDDPADGADPIPERDPLDHDGDGRKGGSVARIDPLSKARAAKKAKRDAEKDNAA